MGDTARGDGGVSGPLHIVVLMGGWSAEREVSLSSGAGVAEALEGLGHRVTRIDMGVLLASGPTSYHPPAQAARLRPEPPPSTTVLPVVRRSATAYS